MNRSQSAQLEGRDCAQTTSATSLEGPLSKSASAIASSILVADDDASLLEAMAVMLESLGHTVTSTRDGRSAWNRLSQGEWFGLLVTDVSMPHMGGLDLLAAVRQARLEIPVVVISGDPANRPHALQAGALAFLDKPFRLGELEAAVAGALANPPRSSLEQDTL